MWNDTDIPLRYLITFRTYGTWLNGDVRGSVSRHCNAFGTSFLPHEPNWLATNQSRMKREAVRLDSIQRELVDKAVKETCAIRDWILYASNVRTNHVHVVVSIGAKRPEIALTAFKANATRLMRAEFAWSSDLTPWAEKGSKRRLWSEKNVAFAPDYVKYDQGTSLENFDNAWEEWEADSSNLNRSLPLPVLTRI